MEVGKVGLRAQLSSLDSAIEQDHAGETWTDVLGWHQGEILIDENGWGDFKCPVSPLLLS